MCTYVCTQQARQGLAPILIHVYVIKLFVTMYYITYIYMMHIVVMHMMCANSYCHRDRAVVVAFMALWEW